MKGYLKYIVIFVLCFFLINTALSIYKEKSENSVGLIITNPVYSISFNKNDNDSTGTMSNQSITYGVSQSLTSNFFEREGYKFMGWATSAGGSVVYSDSQSITVSANTTLYAVWMRVMAENVEYINNDAGCGDVQCMIDFLYNSLY